MFQYASVDFMTATFLRKMHDFILCNAFRHFKQQVKYKVKVKLSWAFQKHSKRMIR